jgi:hypothetical protein
MFEQKSEATELKIRSARRRWRALQTGSFMGESKKAG